jgi:hypothetical protein
MSKLGGTLLGVLVLVALAGCSDNLIYQNPNAPDQTRALARPGDVENLVAASYETIHNNTDGSVGGIYPQMACAGMENYSGLANWGLGPACGIPRASIDNSRGNQTLGEKYGPYVGIHGAVRAAALGLGVMSKPTFTFYPANPAQVQRDRAFAFFVIGVGLGDIAMVYDSGAASGPNDDPQVVLPLLGSDSLGAYALAQLDSTIAILGALTPTNTLPPSWINGNALTPAQFIQLARSWKARIRAGIARTPAARAAVNWVAVAGDAAAGITADFNVTVVNGSPYWGYDPIQMRLFAEWHQMWQFMVGMADTSGAYSTWLNTPVGNRVPFLVVTPDLRFPQGTTRAAQNAASGCSGATCTPPRPDIYFRNRISGQDAPGFSLGFSMYDFYRFQPVFDANANGPVPVMTASEIRLLRAEAQLRLGNLTGPTGAIALVDVSRTAHGLPSLAGAGITDSVTAVPGSRGCVPQLPQPPTYTAAACGRLWEALKWEKRMETAYTHWGAWWIDGRGWGDLPAGTPLQYPVPYQELDTRLKPLYTYSTGAAPGRYGL